MRRSDWARGKCEDPRRAREKLASSLLWVILGVGCSDASVSPAPMDPCAPHHYPVELALTRVISDDAEEFRAVRAAGSRVALCGKKTLRIVDLAGETATERGRSVLSSPCARLAGGDGLVAVVGDAGDLALFTVDNAGALAPAASVSGAAAGFRDVALSGADLYLAAGEAGVKHFVYDGTHLVPSPDVPGAVDAEGVAPLAGNLFVADGSTGVKRLALPGGGVTWSSPPPKNGRVWRLSTDGTRVLALAGADGVALFEGGSHLPESIVFTPTRGVACDGARLGQDIYVADEGALSRYDMGSGALTPLAFLERADRGRLVGAWVAGVARVGDAVLVLDGAGVSALRATPHVPAPHLISQIPNVETVMAATGDDLVARLPISNVGDAPLGISMMACDGPLCSARPVGPAAFDPGCPARLMVPPGQSVWLQITVAPPTPTSPAAGKVILDSDSPTDPERAVPVVANVRPLAVGDLAPDFVLPSYRGATLHLAEQRGRVVLLKFFNSG